MTLILTYEHIQDFSPVYVTAKQRGDTCSSFEVIMQTDIDTHTHTHLPNASHVLHVFMIIA